MIDENVGSPVCRLLAPLAAPSGSRVNFFLFETGSAWVLVSVNQPHDGRLILRQIRADHEADSGTRRRAESVGIANEFRPRLLSFFVAHKRLSAARKEFFKKIHSHRP